jgi:hypothetical protein
MLLVSGTDAAPTAALFVERMMQPTNSWMNPLRTKWALELPPDQMEGGDGMGGGAPAPGYRPAEDPNQSCASCGYFNQSASRCENYKFANDPAFTCDTWAPVDLNLDRLKTGGAVGMAARQAQIQGRLEPPTPMVGADGKPLTPGKTLIGGPSMVRPPRNADAAPALTNEMAPQLGTQLGTQMGKIAAIMAAGDDPPKDWNRFHSKPSKANGGVGSYGEDAWKSLDHYRPKKSVHAKMDRKSLFKESKSVLHSLQGQAAAHPLSPTSDVYSRDQAVRSGGKGGRGNKCSKMTKKAILLPSWGGGRYHVGSGKGIGLDAGYDHMLGLIPSPYVGLRAGTKDFGVSAGGPLPYIGLDNGVRPGGQWTYPRSLWGYAYDKMTGAPDPYTGELPEDSEDKPKPKKKTESKPKKKEKKEERPTAVKVSAHVGTTPTVKTAAPNNKGSFKMPNIGSYQYDSVNNRVPSVSGSAGSAPPDGPFSELGLGNLGNMGGMLGRAAGSLGQGIGGAFQNGIGTAGQTITNALGQAAGRTTSALGQAAGRTTSALGQAAGRAAGAGSAPLRPGPGDPPGGTPGAAVSGVTAGAGKTPGAVPLPTTPVQPLQPKPPVQLQPLPAPPVQPLQPRAPVQQPPPPRSYRDTGANMQRSIDNKKKIVARPAPGGQGPRDPLKGALGQGSKKDLALGDEKEKRSYVKRAQGFVPRPLVPRLVPRPLVPQEQPQVLPLQGNALHAPLGQPGPRPSAMQQSINNKQDVLNKGLEQRIQRGLPFSPTRGGMGPREKLSSYFDRFPAPIAALLGAYAAHA